MVESGRAITPIAWAAAALTAHLFLEECNKSCEHSRSRIRRHVNCTHLLQRLHYMQRGIARRILSVCLSVSPSVRHTRDPWQNGREICPDFYTIRKNIYPSFLRKKNGWWGGDPFYLKCWVNRPHSSEIADFQPIIARSSSAVTPSEKSSINANRKSNTRFPMSRR